MTFWISIFLISIAAMAMICIPLLKSRVSYRGELESEQALYKARLSEIDKDLELGRLDEESAQAVKAEEARRLLKISSDSKTTTATTGNKLILMIAALSLPIISIPFYYTTGTPQVVAAGSGSSAQNTPPTMAELLEIAERRLESTPDDINGWKAVAPVYLRMGRFEEAENAYQNIIRLEGKKPETLLKLADVYIEEKKGQVDERAKALIDEVLSIDKQNPVARYYSGIVSLQAGREDETKQIWQNMIAGASGDEEWLPVIRSRLEELESLNKRPEAPKPELAEEKLADDDEQNAQNEMISQMVENLENKLLQDPQNKEGWEMLVRSYMVLNKPENATKAINAAVNAFPNDEIFEQRLNKFLDGTEKSNSESQ
jgi:cytochrome c-type biogenesis protein CcmH